MPPSKRLLIVAFHFPPIQASTGVTRTLSFAKYLKQHGWEVTVLTATPGAYPEKRSENLESIPSYVRVERALAFDTQRHLSLFGRYPGWLAIPDRWQTWRIPAVMRAASIVKRWRPDVVMSTYPIATAHRIAAAISRRFQIPWVADFRDPMAQPDYPPDPATHLAFEKIEETVFQRAARIVVTTPGTAHMYRERFRHFAPEHIAVIPNGFDPAMFPATSTAPPDFAQQKRPLVLLHSGVVYPVERDPTMLFEAVGELRKEGAINPADVQIHFRASAHERQYEPQVTALGIADIVGFLPAIPYRDAIAEMAAADAFLLLQASNCNDQIPAKLYEYLYCERPILGLTDPTGDTAATMRSVGSTCIARLDNKEEIKAWLPRFVELARQRMAPTPTRSQIQHFSREGATQALAQVLDGI